MAAAARAAGTPVVREAFADRRYNADGSLVARSEPGSLLTVDEAAALLKVKSSTVRQWVRDGRIPCYRLVPRATRFTPQLLRDFAAAESFGHKFQDLHLAVAEYASRRSATTINPIGERVSNQNFGEFRIDVCATLGYGPNC